MRGREGRCSWRNGGGAGGVKKTLGINPNFTRIAECGIVALPDKVNSL